MQNIEFKMKKYIKNNINYFKFLNEEEENDFEEE